MRSEYFLLHGDGRWMFSFESYFASIPHRWSRECPPDFSLMEQFNAKVQTKSREGPQTLLLKSHHSGEGAHIEKI